MTSGTVSSTVSGTVSGTVINGGTVVTMDPGRRVLAPGYVEVRAGRITAIGPGRREPAPGDRQLELAGDLVLPGFVNTHHHLAATLLRGVAEDGVLHLHPDPAAPRRRLHGAQGEQACHAGALLATVELVRSGVTTTTDSQVQWRDLHKADGSLRAAHESGLRVVFSAAFIDRTEMVPTDRQFDLAGSLAEFARLKERWAGGRVAVIPEAMSAPRASDALIRALAEAGDGRLAMHLAYSPAVADWALAGYGVPLVEHLDRLGVLSPGFLGAHPVHVTDREVAIYAERGAGAAYCAVSNMYIGSGHAPLGRLLAAGVPVGLGLDTPNDGHNFFETVKMSLLAQKQAAGGPAYDPGDALAWATIGGAAALGLAGEIGSLELGKRADLIVVDPTPVQLAPPAAAIPLLVTAGAPELVTHVMVDGEWLLRDRALTRLDEPAVLAAAAAAQAGVLADAGVAAPALPRGWRLVRG